MRAAIAKRFSGDAAPELFRFFRISVGFGCEACACLGAFGRSPKVATRLAAFASVADDLYQDCDIFLWTLF